MSLNQRPAKPTSGLGCRSAVIVSAIGRPNSSLGVGMMRAYSLMSAEHAVSNIALRRIKISRLIDVNDPFELEAINVANKKDFRSALRDWKGTLNETKGLLCLSKSWQNPVLWSHYGARHTGICLGFDVDPECFKNVAYEPDRIVAAVENDSDYSPSEELVQQLLFTKFKHWSYEEEVRAYIELDKSTAEGGMYFLPFSERFQLREVILGARCTLSLSTIRNLVQPIAPKVHAIKGRLAFRTFKVVEDESAR